MEVRSKLVGGDDDTIIKADKSDLVIEIKRLLSEVEESSIGMEEISSQKIKASIYKLPEFMRAVQPKAFEPCLVSFGPYHYGKPHLVEMERNKKKGFSKFTAKYNLHFETIAESVCNILELLLGSYDKLEDEWKQNPAMFLKLMIVDGCFLLDFFEECPHSLSSMSWDIRRDMLLLENQLPNILLLHIYNLAHKKNDIEGLRSLICKSMFIEPVDAVIWNEVHILAMYRASLLYPPVNTIYCGGLPKNYNLSNPNCRIIPQATELRDARIKFKCSPTKGLGDVSFDRNQGVLKLPYLVVDDYSETSLLNVMAFEKFHGVPGSQVTSYVILMDNLINVDKDVALLVSKKILANTLGDDQSAAYLFNLLGKGAAMDLDNHIIDVHNAVNKHYSKSWNKLWASLKPDYLQHKWALISVLAATFGFALIILQVAYQIADYNRGN